MARGQAGIWKRKGRKNWYAWINGAQTNLGTAVKEKALTEWHRLSGTQPERKPAKRLYVVVLLEQFLDHLYETDSPYHGWYKSRVNSFAKSIPKFLLLSELTPAHVTAWMRLHDGWSPTHKAGSISAVQRALNWHLEEGTIKRNPLAKVRKPKRTRREFAFTKEQIVELLKALPEPAKTFVTLVAATGCRPSEMARAKGAHVSADGATIEVRSSKNDKLDPMPVPASLRPMVLALAKASGDGWLCKTERGRQWTRKSWCLAIRSIRKAAKLDSAAVAYALRHTWATERIKEGWNAGDVALAMRTSIAMVSKVYAHLLGERTRGLADKLT